MQSLSFERGEYMEKDKLFSGFDFVFVDVFFAVVAVFGFSRNKVLKNFVFQILGVIADETSMSGGGGNAIPLIVILFRISS